MVYTTPHIVFNYLRDENYKTCPSAILKDTSAITSLINTRLRIIGAITTFYDDNERLISYILEKLQLSSF